MRLAKKNRSAAISAALALVLLTALLSGCSLSAAAPTPGEPSESAEPVSPAEPAAGAEPTADTEPASPSEPAEPSAPEAGPVRQDGERFEGSIFIEGMEETVRYEHIRNDALGFEMDYDYERFVRLSEADREFFVSCWDDPAKPEYSLEVTRSAQDAETVAAALSEALSKEYEISRNDSFPLARAGSCIRIDASAEPGGLTMPDHLQMVYIVPAADGCRVAVAHYAIEGAEGFGRRFHCMMDSFSVLPGQGEQRLSDEQALAAIRNYCCRSNPDLESIVNAGEYPVYWEVASGDAREIVILFRSYTGSLNRYYIDPVSGDTYVTELAPGSTDTEQRTEESFNAWDYLA